MLPFVLTKTFFKSSLANDFPFPIERGLHSKEDWWLESKELGGVLLPAKYKLVIVLLICQATPLPAAHQANGVWQVGSCLESFQIRRLSDMPHTQLYLTFGGIFDMQAESFQA